MPIPERKLRQLAREIDASSFNWAKWGRSLQNRGQTDDLAYESWAGRRTSRCSEKDMREEIWMQAPLNLYKIDANEFKSKK